MLKIEALGNEIC